MLVSLMGSSILSEGCQHLDSQEGALQCYYDPLNRLPVSRLLLPLSGLERSDFVRWARRRPLQMLPSCPLFGVMRKRRSRRARLPAPAIMGWGLVGGSSWTTCS
jgi:hypothetical protein